jgi:hypothetical protein
LIAKITRGADAGGLVRYLMGEGRAEEHTGQRVVAASDMVVVPIGESLSAEEVGELGRQLDAARLLYGTEVEGGHVWHLALSNPVGDRELSDAEWAGVAADAMERLGFTGASGKAPCRWVAVRHGRSVGGHDHVHVAVSLVREDGTKASIWRDRVRMSELCAGAERHLGLTVVDGRARGGLPGAGRAETEAAARRGRPEPERVSLARLVRGAAVASVGEAEFVRRLRAAGAVARPRFAEGGTTQVVGYSVALKPTTGERPVWFGGGRLARDLALPALRAGWQASPESPEEVLAEWGGRRPRRGDQREDRVLREEGWANAAGRVDLAGARLGELAAGDRARWAAVARESAGIFGAWSARVEAVVPGAFARAADTLGWSAQARELGRAGEWRGPETVDFAGVAGVVAQSAIGPKSAMGWVLLLRSMARTVELVRAAHEARGEALQAARLAQLVTVELRQAQARLEAEAVLVGGGASEVQAGQEARPSTLGELLDMSEPVLGSYEPGRAVQEPMEGNPATLPGRDDELGLD